MSVATRFAPSPTGLLHVGNARTALVAWLHARHLGGRYVLRIDDTDTERSTPAFAEAIEADLGWLGIDWDVRVRQSDRSARYVAAIDRLRQDGRLYPCYETAEELALKRKSALQAGRPPVYDRAALTLGAADRERFEAKGRRPHWRFKLEHAEIAWQDMVRGPVRFHGADLSDPVLIREDGRPLYHLCSVVDDIELGITHVVRGEDHVANTAAHAQMFQALDAPPPVFAHLPLLVDVDGRPLSKRLGSLSLQAMRDAEGLEPEALTSLLGRLGTSQPIEPLVGAGSLVDGFDFGQFGRAAPRFDQEELRRLNARVLHALPFDVAAPRLAAAGLADADPAFWEAVRPNLERLGDAADWWQIARGTVAPVVAAEDADYLTASASALPPDPWGPETWSAWVGQLKSVSGRKGKALFHPLRRALTGRDAGPELHVLLPMIGRDRAVARLSGRTA